MLQQDEQNGCVLQATIATEDRAVTRPGRTFGQTLLALAGATGIVLLAPVAILLVGLPVVLAVRGVVEGIGWLLGVALQ